MRWVGRSRVLVPTCMYVYNAVRISRSGHAEASSDPDVVRDASPRPEQSVLLCRGAWRGTRTPLHQRCCC